MDDDGLGKRMTLRYAGTCRDCGSCLAAGTTASYERATRTLRCLHCLSVVLSKPERGSTTIAPAADGAAGASARREHERRKARDEQRLRDRWGKFGGIAVALSDEKQSTNAWSQGAVGEERLGARLDALASPTLRVLHDRRIPGTRANIDHLVVTTAGVWVIDAKRYQGQRPALKVEGGIVRPRVEKLLVGGRHRTKLVDGVVKQVGLVRDVLGDAPVTGVLCFVDADWPLLGGAFTVSHVEVVWPKRLAATLATQGGDVDVAFVVDQLASRFPSA